jgi:hypothetical protein
MVTHKREWNAAVIVLTAVWSLEPAVASAQSTETEEGEGEVSVLGGATFASGAHAAVTASAGSVISRYGMVLLETTFMPLGNSSIQPWPARSTINRSFVYDFGLNFHVRIPINERWAPYGIVGAGVLWDLVRQHTVDSQGVLIVKHWDQVNGAFHTGAGLRYYIGKNWGIRPEVKVIASKQIYTQVTLGIFYVTPSEWP